MLKVYHDSVWYRLKGVSRFHFLKFFYGKRFKSQGISLVGGHCDLIITKSGKLNFGKKIVLCDHVQLYTSGELNLGSKVTINEYSRIIAHSSISIGSDVTIAKFVSILDHDHAYQFVNNQLQIDGYYPIKGVARSQRKAERRYSVGLCGIPWGRFIRSMGSSPESGLLQPTTLRLSCALNGLHQEPAFSLSRRRYPSPDQPAASRLYSQAITAPPTAPSNSPYSAPTITSPKLHVAW